MRYVSRFKKQYHPLLRSDLAKSSSHCLRVWVGDRWIEFTYSRQALNLNVYPLYSSISVDCVYFCKVKLITHHHFRFSDLSDFLHWIWCPDCWLLTGLRAPRRIMPIIRLMCCVLVVMSWTKSRTPRIWTVVRLMQMMWSMKNYLIAKGLVTTNLKLKDPIWDNVPKTKIMAD